MHIQTRYEVSTSSVPDDGRIEEAGRHSSAVEDRMDSQDRRTSFRATGQKLHASQRLRISPTDSVSRVKRGCTFGKPVGESSFRAHRGGEQLWYSSWSLDPFDQADYVARQVNRRGSCEGWNLEVMRRIDRDATPGFNVAAAVREMRDDVDSTQGEAAADLLHRVDHFQENRHSLGLRRYLPGAEVTFNSAADGDATSEGMFTSLLERLRADGLAHVRLGAASSASTGGEGHALLVQRTHDERYIVFDANNGAFTYSSYRAFREGFARYLNTAFSDRGLQLRPDSIHYYDLADPDTAQGALAERPVHEVPALPPLREPAEPVPRPESDTRAAYRRSASMSNSLSSDVLAAASGERYAMLDVDHGLAMSALQEIAQGRSPTLVGATEEIRRKLSDWAKRTHSMREINDYQQQNRYGLVGPILGSLTRQGEGAVGLMSADLLVDDVRRAFENVQIGDDPNFGHPTEFAVLRLDFRNLQATTASPVSNPPRHADGQSVVVQRLHNAPGYLNDQYELYDPDAGVFRYANFSDLASALHGMFDTGYRELGGIDRVSTTYYADVAAPVAMGGNMPVETMPSRTRLATLGLDAVESLLGAAGGPLQGLPVVDLPEPPMYFDPDMELPHATRKRSTQERGASDPIGLFRPSTIGPRELKAAGGFECAAVKVGDINLRMHDLDLAANPHVIDSAGYLGTFRSEQTALKRAPCTPGDSYIYYVAPTPNMVDVNGTLRNRASDPKNGEFAAMGRIDYAQIRGWREVKNGVPSAYVRNPEYRWDVYDQTSTAGAQPSLSRFPINSSVWREDKFRAFVSDNAKGDAKVFNISPDVAHAMFYDGARQKVRDLYDRAATGLDYRGPLRIQAYGEKNRSSTQIYLDAKNNLYVDTMFSPYSGASGTRHDFVFGEDGRFHVSGDYGKVLGVGHDGYVYLRAVPADPASLNGVFEYDGRYLVHQEDGKFLTTGLSSFTPFVDRYIRGERSQWQLLKPDRKPYISSRINLHMFRERTAGSAAQLYAFYKDPDSALPQSATRFVTTVPGNPYSGKFLEYVDKYIPADLAHAADWLRRSNAAWLFKDGFHAVSNAPGRLEVCTLDGTSVWRAEGLDGDLSKAKFTRTRGTLSSNFRVRDETWQRVQHREQRSAFVLEQLNGLRWLM
jgi:hypothetical protein